MLLAKDVIGTNILTYRGISGDIEGTLTPVSDSKRNMRTEFFPAILTHE